MSFICSEANWRRPPIVVKHTTAKSTPSPQTGRLSPRSGKYPVTSPPPSEPAVIPPGPVMYSPRKTVWRIARLDAADYRMTSALELTWLPFRGAPAHNAVRFHKCRTRTRLRFLLVRWRPPTRLASMTEPPTEPKLGVWKCAPIGICLPNACLRTEVPGAVCNYPPHLHTIGCQYNSAE